MFEAVPPLGPYVAAKISSPPIEIVPVVSVTAVMGRLLTAPSLKRTTPLPPKGVMLKGLAGVGARASPGVNTKGTPDAEAVE